MPKFSIDYKGAGRKVNVASSPKPGALQSSQPTRVNNPQGLNDTAHSPGVPSKVQGNEHVAKSGVLPPGIRDAQLAHDLDNMNHRSVGSTHPRGPEWLRNRREQHQQDEMRRMLESMGGN